MRFVEKVGRRLERTALVRPKETLVVACSGGVDSVVLADVMSELSRSSFKGISLTLAHLDHGLRKDSPQDFALVEKLAHRLGVPFYGRRIELAKELGEKPTRVEETARSRRYDFFRDAAGDARASAVLTGHHADDQVETIIQRLARGTGMRGLAGIPHERELAPGVRVVRPLLTFFRDEILAYAEERGLEFRDDYTNEDVSFSRNLIREAVIPFLDARLPGFSGHILDVADRARDASAALAEPFQRFIDDVQLEGVRSFDLKKLKKADDFFLGLLLDHVYDSLGAGRGGLARGNYEAFYDFIVKGAHRGRLNLPGGVTALVDRDALVFNPVENEAPGPALSGLPVPGEAEFGDWKFSTRRLGVNEINARDFFREKTRYEEILDAGAIEGGLVVRCRRHGDRFHPLGAPGESNLGDFLTGLKLSLEERKGLPLVVSGERVLWVVGHRLADWAKVTKETESFVHIKAARAPRRDGEYNH